MSQSAGGQAIALVSIALCSLFNDDTVGDVLRELSQRLIPA